MRPQLFKLPFPSDTSFFYSKYECDYFERPWHFHKEFELVYIHKSKGTKFIGNKVQPFEEGDLTLIGADIPHLFRNDAIYYDKDFKNQASSIFIHFNPSYLGNNIFEIPEFSKIKKLLDGASLGLQIQGKTQLKIVEILWAMDALDVAQRMISLITILDLLSKSDEVSPILTIPFVEKNTKDADQINKVFNHLMLNYPTSPSIPNFWRKRLACAFLTF